MSTTPQSAPKERNPLISPMAWKRLLTGRIPGQAVIQYTDRCNASCAQCGMRVSNKFERSTMDKDTVRRLIDAMAERGVQALSFTGGEPLLYFEEIAELSEYAGRAGIKFIRTGTNGYIFRGADKPDFEDRMRRFAERMAATPLRTFWVSVDSADPEAHEKNRGLSGVVKGLEKALPIFREYDLYPSANLGINRHTGGWNSMPSMNGGFDRESFYNAARESFRKFYRFVEDLGFTIVNACYPMSFDEAEAESSAVYAATSIDDFIRFTVPEKIELFRALHDVAPEYRSRLRIFTPRSSLLGLIRHYEGREDSNGDGPGHYACRGGIDFFFVDARDMNTYPCGYRGDENLGKFWDLDMSRLKPAGGPWCKKCDWECFRDPSEMIGPFTDILTHPLRLAGAMLRDKEYRATWIEDVCYYKACDFFNARLAPDKAKLAKFAR